MSADQSGQTRSALQSENPQIAKSDVPWMYRGPVMKIVFLIGGVSIIFGSLVDSRFHSGRPGLLDAVAALIAATPFGWLAGILVAGATSRRITKAEGDQWAVAFHPTLGFRDSLWGLCFFAACEGTIVLRAVLAGPPYHWWPPHDGAMVACLIVFSCAMALRYDRWYQSLPDEHTTDS